jgi:hypothetical protein
MAIRMISATFLGINGRNSKRASAAAEPRDEISLKFSHGSSKRQITSTHGGEVLPSVQTRRLTVLDVARLTFHKKVRESTWMRRGLVATCSGALLRD